MPLQRLRLAAQALNCSVLELEHVDDELIEKAASALLAEREAEAELIKSKSNG